MKSTPALVNGSVSATGGNGIESGEVTVSGDFGAGIGTGSDCYGHSKI
jgi:formylmethanofuran dehydrogenase subunit C